MNWLAQEENNQRITAAPLRPLYWMHDNEAWLELIMAFEGLLAAFCTQFVPKQPFGVHGIAYDKVISHQLKAA